MDKALFILAISALKTCVLLIVSFGAVRLFRQSVVRHLIWTLTLTTVLVLPVLTWIGPSWSFSALLPPVQLTGSETQQGADPTEEITSATKQNVNSPEPDLERQPDRSVSLHSQQFVDLKPVWKTIQPYSSLLVGIWLIGLLAILRLYVRQLWQIRHILKHGLPTTDPGWDLLVQDYAKIMHVHRPVRIITSEHVSVPLAFGILHPTVILPVEASCWELERRRIVLLHELGHIARWDQVSLWIGLLGCALYWFNPLVWRANRQLTKEREQACDDLVVALGTHRIDYASHLLSLARTTLHRSLISISLVSRSGDLEHRIRAILDSRRHRQINARWLLLLTVVLLTMLVPFSIVQPVSGRDIAWFSQPGNSDSTLQQIQALAETELKWAVEKYGAISGSLLIMDLRTGAILGITSYPLYHLPARDRAIQYAYEPGFVFSTLTGAIALQSGKINRHWTYVDSSPFKIGGLEVYNWDRAGHGTQTFDDVFIYSWNIGTAQLAVQLTPSLFYKGLDDFGVGQRTEIDVPGETSGYFRTPGDGYWRDSDLATNSYGQGLVVTPLQMLSFVNAFANHGQIMRPYVATDQTVVTPSLLRAPISPEVAQQMTDILVQAVKVGAAKKAHVQGYDIAGIAGTAQIPCPTCPDAYERDYYNATFIGYFPAEAPQVSVLITLHSVGTFASQTAAPAFADVAKRLVKILAISPQP